MSALRTAFSTVRSAIKAVWLAGFSFRDDTPYFYSFEDGHYSIEAERSAALAALHLPPDWIYAERDLRRARADHPGTKFQAVLFLVKYHHDLPAMRQFERDMNTRVSWEDVRQSRKRASLSFRLCP
jgi:hypothetical protein